MASYQHFELFHLESVECALKEVTSYPGSLVDQFDAGSRTTAMTEVESIPPLMSELSDFNNCLSRLEAIWFTFLNRVRLSERQFRLQGVFPCSHVRR